MNEQRVRVSRVALVGVMLLTASCAYRQVQPSPQFNAEARWVVLPFVNQSETPSAGERVASISAAALRLRGMNDLLEFQNKSTELPELDEQVRLEKAISWAKERGYAYGLTGRVQEWRYRAGLDGESAVGVTLSIVDIASGKVIWTATGARSGWGTETVAGNANTLLRQLLADLKVP